MKTLEEMKNKLNLAPMHLMLLANTGSMTALLEAIFGKVSIETLIQRVTDADEGVARLLDIREGEPVNHRVVKLVGRRVLVHATSYAPFSRLKKSFKEDIMRRDIPIGMIMARHSMESRREILGFDWLKAGSEFSNVFNVSPDSILLKRNYNIIYKVRPLINITEVFPYDIVRCE